MIQANELRIGNLLLKEGVIVTIDGRSIMDIEFSKQYAEKYNAIPLTKDFLLKNGFKESLNNNHWTILNLQNIFEVSIVLTNHNGWKKGQILAGNDDTTVQHIHQLQNLYFALTQKELTIKP